MAEAKWQRGGCDAQSCDHEGTIMCVFEVSTHVSCIMVCVCALVHEDRMVVCVCVRCVTIWMCCTGSIVV